MDVEGRSIADVILVSCCDLAVLFSALSFTLFLNVMFWRTQAFNLLFGEVCPSFNASVMSLFEIECISVWYLVFIRNMRVETTLNGSSVVLSIFDISVYIVERQSQQDHRLIWVSWLRLSPFTNISWRIYGE